MAKAVYGLRASEAYGTSSKAGHGLQAREASGPAYGTTSRTFQTAEDIIPIAELKANMSEIVRGLDDRPRPLVVTLNGKPAAVVMSPREYDLLSYRSRFVDAVSDGLADADAGRTYDGEQVVTRLLSELGRKKPRKARAR
jgi:prevent-host-death family protein